MLTVDGSFGEGGGQILRSSLALSMVTGRPFRIENIRAGREKPGLMRQHLTAVTAAAQVCGAEIIGASIGSMQVEFRPGSVCPGDYLFSVGTAGSTTLVCQTVLPALLVASGPSSLVFEGGTHNPHAPPFDFLARAYLPLIQRMGPRVTARIERPGFYPAGGGRWLLSVEPTAALAGFELTQRGQITGRRARVLISNLPAHIAERELSVLRKKTGWEEDCFHLEPVPDPAGPGNAVLVEIEAEHVTEVFSGIGEVHRPAESVATGTLRSYQAWLRAGVPVGEYLADQLMLPLAIAGTGRYLTTPLTPHSTTHIELIRRFLDVDVRACPRDQDGWLVEIGR
jgi:RNA 3'-terminal phosphate cyclase (ATP)